MSNDKILAEQIADILLSQNLINEKSLTQLKKELADGNITSGNWVTYIELQMLEESKSEEE